jgi:hypothetical protein
VGLLFDDLRFHVPKNLEASVFWNRLGLKHIGDSFYKVVGGICRAVYGEKDLKDLEALTAVLPRNATLLSPYCYLQEGLEGFEAVVRIEIAANEFSAAFSVETRDVISLIANRNCEIVAQFITELSEKARKLYERRENYRRQEPFWLEFVAQLATDTDFALAVSDRFYCLDLELDDFLVSGASPKAMRMVRASFRNSMGMEVSVQLGDHLGHGGDTSETKRIWNNAIVAAFLRNGYETPELLEM